MTIQTYKMCGNPEFSGAAYSPIMDAACYSVVDRDVYEEWVKEQEKARRGKEEGQGDGKGKLEKGWLTLDGEGKAKTGDPRGEALREQLAKGEKKQVKEEDSMWKLLGEMAESLAGKVKKESEGDQEGEGKKKKKKKGKAEAEKEAREYTSEELEAMSPEELKQVILDQQKRSRKDQGARIILAGGIPVGEEGGAMALDLSDLLGGLGGGVTTGKGGKGTKGSDGEKHDRTEEMKEQERQLQALLDSVLESVDGKGGGGGDSRRRRKKEEEKEEGLVRDEL